MIFVRFVMAVCVLFRYSSSDDITCEHSTQISSREEKKRFLHIWILFYSFCIHCVYKTKEKKPINNLRSIPCKQIKLKHSRANQSHHTLYVYNVSFCSHLDSTHCNSHCHVANIKSARRAICIKLVDLECTNYAPIFGIRRSFG